MTLKGWRTYLFNGAMAVAALALEVAPAVLSVAEMREVLDVIPDGWLPWWVLVVALGNLWLRSVTTTPPGRSE